jgi:hypothetical protein
MMHKAPPERKPWMDRPVMWSLRGGVTHVVINAVVNDLGVEQMTACGLKTFYRELTVCSWFGHTRRNRPDRLYCGQCMDLLMAAGGHWPLVR